MTEADRELMQRYIYQVVRRLAKDQREETARELELEKETNAKLTARWIEGGYGQMLAFRGNGTIEYKTARSMLKAYADQAIDTFAEKALVEGQGAVILEVRIVPQIPTPEKP